VVCEFTCSSQCIHNFGTDVTEYCIYLTLDNRDERSAHYAALIPCVGDSSGNMSERFEMESGAEMTNECDRMNEVSSDVSEMFSELHNSFADSLLSRATNNRRRERKGNLCLSQDKEVSEFRRMHQQ
jgi:hypothetical protein